MYRLEQDKDRIDILYNDNSVLGKVLPILNLVDQEKCVLENKGCLEDSGEDEQGAFTEYCLEYGDSASNLKLELAFRCYETMMLLNMSIRSDIEMVGGRSKRLGEDGVVLQVGSIDPSQGLMANYMHKDWWSRPCFDQSIENLPARTQSLLWKDSQYYHHLLPLCDDIFRTQLSGDKEGLKITTGASVGGYSNFHTLAFVLSSGQKPFELVQRTARAGASLLSSAGGIRSARRYPDMLEYLGWCSWDAFYYDINDKGVIKKAEEFKNKGLPVKWFIVDAGWSEDEDTMLKSFRPHPEKFPEGFGPMIKRLKEEYGLDWVGVWHTLIGYWKGIDPKSALALEMREALYTTNCGTVIPRPEAELNFKFWNEWHSYLKKQGVDFVKVDYQSVLVNLLKGSIAIGKAAREMHSGLEASVAVNFDNRMINCMGMASENIWHRPASAVARSSDDFFPKSEEGFREHAFQNAYNSFYHSQLFWGDWDMWWTNHEHSLNHAVLRAVSGGPVYVSDPLGETNPGTLWPLILSDGRILRCQESGLPTQDCLTRDPRKERIPLKIWNQYEKCGIVAAFNINDSGVSVEGCISPSDIPGYKSESCVVFDYFEKKAYVLDREDGISCRISDMGVKLYLMVPLQDGFASMGLMNKYISVAAVESEYVMRDKAVVELKEGGIYGFFSAKTVDRIFVNGEIKEFHHEGGIYRVDCSEYKARKVLLEICMAHEKKEETQC